MNLDKLPRGLPQTESTPPPPRLGKGVVGHRIEPMPRIDQSKQLQHNAEELTRVRERIGSIDNAPIATRSGDYWGPVEESPEPAFEPVRDPAAHAPVDERTVVINTRTQRPADFARADERTMMMKTVPEKPKTPAKPAGLLDRVKSWFG